MNSYAVKMNNYVGMKLGMKLGWGWTLSPAIPLGITGVGCRG